MSIEIGRYKVVVGYTENINEIVKVLNTCNKVALLSDIMKEALAQVIWYDICFRYKHIYTHVYEEDVDKAINRMKTELEKIPN